jgi:hypothetical protein
MIRVTWAAYHDCDHIYITPLVDLLFYEQRYNDAFVSNVWVAIYVSPFLYTCYDQTSMLGH